LLHLVAVLCVGAELEVVPTIRGGVGAESEVPS
jgi:hypothetical protein